MHSAAGAVQPGAVFGNDALTQLLHSAAHLASRVAIVCNPLAWLSQKVFRFASGHAYIRWFVANHVSSEWSGHRLKLARFRYRSPDLPSRAVVRPFSRAEACSACLDVMLVPLLVHAAKALVVSTFFNASLSAGEADHPPHVAVAVLTPSWWLARLATGHFSNRQRARPVLLLFDQGGSSMERRAASLVHDRTHRQLGQHRPFLGDADVLAALLLRCALAARVINLDTGVINLDRARLLRLLRAAYALPCALGALAMMTMPVWLPALVLGQLVGSLFGGLGARQKP